MDRIRIRGGRPLVGTIHITGAKNAALPLMAASLLTDETLILKNVPRVADIVSLGDVLARHGVSLAEHGVDGDGGLCSRCLSLQAKSISTATVPYELVRKMRASILVLGPLLARCGEARVSLPGGCAIGNRPVDLHLKAFEQLGARIELVDGYITAAAPRGLHGAEIRFPTVSVGATENIMMAACLADGETVIANAAREPEVSDLARCLVAMGAKISGIDGDRLVISGVSRLRGTGHEVLPDRIETGTYMMAAGMTGGDVELVGGRLDLLSSVVEKLEEAGIKVENTQRGLRVWSNESATHGVDVMTQTYPGFPTDLQAQMMALMTTSRGASMITETIFENRFMHVPELCRMGANITVHGASALIRGVPELTGAQVMATDLRASVSLVIAGLAADGDTVINRVYHLDRGYESIEQKLANCGADIVRIND